MVKRAAIPDFRDGFPILGGRLWLDLLNTTPVDDAGNPDNCLAMLQPFLAGKLRRNAPQLPQKEWRPICEHFAKRCGVPFRR